jgi:hypothetical protein
LNDKLSNAHPGEVLVDVGCGNGKYLGDENFKHVQQIGLDYRLIIFRTSLLLAILSKNFIDYSTLQ